MADAARASPGAASAAPSAAAPDINPRRPRAIMMTLLLRLTTGSIAWSRFARSRWFAGPPPPLTAESLGHDLVQFRALLVGELRQHLGDDRHVLLEQLAAQFLHVIDQRVDLRQVEIRLLQLRRHRFADLLHFVEAIAP